MTTVAEENTNEENEQEKSNLPKIWRGLTSVPVLTLGFLFMCELLLRLGNPVDALGFRSVDVWNLGPRIELVRKTCPEVALIGSSLLLVLNQDESGTHFYTGNYPPYFRDLLSKATGDKIQCVNLCSGMQSVPEAYLISEAITSGKCYPKVIIYGIGLREFIDFVFAAEWNGECFNSVAAYAPADFRLMLGNLYTQRTINEFFLSHHFYLYRNRNDLRNMLNAITKDALEYLPLAKSFNRIGPNHQFEPQRQGYLYETWLPKRMEKFGEEIYRSNPDFLHTYYKRYWVTMFERLKLDPRMLKANVEIEGHYLQRLAKLCEEKSIILVVVNMPISKEFQDLAPPGLYDSYRALLRDAANVTGATGAGAIIDAATTGEDNYILLDYLNDPDFDDKSFKDGVHLSYEGAKKLAEKLTAAFQKDHPEIIRVIERQHRKTHESQGGE